MSSTKRTPAHSAYNLPEAAAAEAAAAAATAAAAEAAVDAPVPGSEAAAAEDAPAPAVAEAVPTAVAEAVPTVVAEGATEAVVVAAVAGWRAGRLRRLRWLRRELLDMDPTWLGLGLLKDTRKSRRKLTREGIVQGRVHQR